MIPVVMEDRVRVTKSWGGPVGMVLGSRLYVDCAGNINDADYMKEKMDSLYDAIIQVIGKPINNSAAAVAPLAVTPVQTHCPLTSLSEEDCSALLASLSLEDSINLFKKNHVNGEILNFCDSVDEVKELGIALTAKAKMFFNLITRFKTDGVPVDYIQKKNSDQDDIAVEKEMESPAEADELLSELCGIPPAEPVQAAVVAVSTHEHTLTKIGPVNSGWACNGIYENGGCRSGITSFHQTAGVDCFRCISCDYDLCPQCVNTFAVQTPLPVAPIHIVKNIATVSVHAHKLYLKNCDNGWACDGRQLSGGCKSNITDFYQTSGMERLSCDACNYDLCRKCTEAYILPSA